MEHVPGPESVTGCQLKDNSLALSAPKVIGLYGIPGAGKTFLLNQLEKQLGQDEFTYYEGSDVICSFVDGGLAEFCGLAEEEKRSFRQRAIDSIRSQCSQTGKIGIVTGHFMFWSAETDIAERVYTQNDLSTFTHILYLNPAAEVLAQRRLADSRKDRSNCSTEHLQRWQDREIQELRELCRHHNILFATIYPNLEDKLSKFILDFQRHDENDNLLVAARHLDEAISPQYGTLETVLFFDADKTLSAKDTGALFWRKLANSEDDDSPLHKLFGSQLGYSYTAFRQAALLYEETVNDAEFDVLCEDVASQTPLYPEFVTLLHRMKHYSHICPIIVTCGLRRIWEHVIAREGLSGTVKILGGGRIDDELLVTPSVKSAVVDRAKNVHQAYTWAFGDSPLDLPMMAVADEAIVVVGEKKFRSKTMDSELSIAIEKGLHARQVLLPKSCPMRLDTTKLPIIDLVGDNFVNLVVQHRIPPGGLQLVEATNTKAAQLLMTPMRDSAVEGPNLREAHFEAGAYLARQYLSELIGLEEVTLRHSQGHDIVGHRLFQEKRALIVAIMRAGEPMALGINKVFPEAMFLHASRPDEIKPHHVEGNLSLILVDSVINNGTTLVRFVQHIKSLHAAIRIVVVTGVVQRKVVAGCSSIRRLTRSSELTLVALRVSENKYTGTGSTDTGNRLYNTTHLA
ncbi:uracil phosphoribosyltransferase-domain-containing protein [Aspergillus carlsbadensis]|nr:uracil phosphoribosyltransferase-domain-containing protein [Aspergillus carlsbadensis]